MSTLQALLALACVVSISVGQLLFKLVGNAINAAGSPFASRPALLAALAISIYGAATVGWIQLLRSVPLTRAYPFMALSFCLVPFFGSLFLQERLSSTYLAGILLIIVGVLLVGRPA